MNKIIFTAAAGVALTSSLPAAGFARVDDFNGHCHHVGLTPGLNLGEVRPPVYPTGSSTCT